MMLRHLPIVGAAFLLSACATRDVSTKIDGADAAMAAYETQSPLNAVNASPLQIVDRPYVGDTVINLATQSSYPARFQEPGSFAISSATPRTLSWYAARITQLTGIPVSLDMMQPDPNGQSPGGAPAASGDAPNAAIEAMIARANASATGGPAAAVAVVDAAPLTCPNTFSACIATLESRFDVSADYDGRTLRFVRFAPETFQLAAICGTMALTTATTGDPSSNGGGGGSSPAGGLSTSGISSSGSASVGSTTTQTSSYTQTFDAAADMETSLKGIVGGRGSVSINHSSCRVTVVGPPSLRRIAKKHIETENRRFEKTITVKIQLLSIEDNGNDNYGFDLAAVLNNYGSRYGISGPVFAGDSDGGTIRWSVVNPPAGSALGRLNGSDFAIRALSKASKIKLENTASVTTQNGVAAPITQADRVDYVLQTQSNLVSQVGQSLVRIPGTVIVGFVGHIIPRVKADGRIEIHYALSFRQLVSLTTIGDATSSLQLPRISERNFRNTVTLDSATTFITSQYSETTQSIEDKGVGSPSFFLLGGGSVRTDNQRRHVLLITPVQHQDPAL